MGYKQLKLENQLCFPLYAASKKTTRLYKPLLDPLGITYTQYIVLMVLWEYDSMSVKALGEKLYLDSGTLTPVLKKLENKELLERKRSDKDERIVIVTLSDTGKRLEERAKSIPDKMLKCLNLSSEDLKALHRILNHLLVDETEC